MTSEYFLIGADFVPTDSNMELCIQGDTQELFGTELKSVIDNAEYRIFNLEIPLANEEKPIIKWGPNLIAPEKAVNVYTASHVDLLTLANNHIMDQSDQGLRSTTSVLHEACINYVGAGKNLEEASQPFIFTFSGRKVGVYACAEHEFSIADEDSPGANPFDPLWSLDHVTELKSRCDFVIVLYHGGKEHYRYPSPMLRKTCRRLVDKGVDLVVCQHSHCIGCEEKYKSGTIVYGQGNFLFDNSKNECWQTGLLLKIDISFNITHIPVVKDNHVVRIAKGKIKDDILDAFFHRSVEIQKSGYVEDAYNRLAEKSYNNYLSAFSGKESLVFRILNRLSHGKIREHTLARRYRIQQRVKIWNYIECEAHNELFLRGLKNANSRS